MHVTHTGIRDLGWPKAVWTPINVWPWINAFITQSSEHGVVGMVPTIVTLLRKWNMVAGISPAHTTWAQRTFECEAWSLRVLRNHKILKHHRAFQSRHTNTKERCPYCVTFTYPSPQHGQRACNLWLSCVRVCVCACVWLPFWWSYTFHVSRKHWLTSTCVPWMLSGISLEIF